MIEDDIASPLSFFPSLCLFFPVRRQSLPSFFFPPLPSSFLFYNYVVEYSSGEFGGRPPLPRIERVFSNLANVEIVKKKTRARDATRFLSREQKGGREVGRGAKRFFFCGRKGDYAAGLATVCPIDRPIRSLLGIRLRWMIKRGRD